MLKYVEITCLFCFWFSPGDRRSGATSRRLDSPSDPSKFLLHVELALNKEMRRRGTETAQVRRTKTTRRRSGHHAPLTEDKRRGTKERNGQKTNVQRAGHPREEERQRLHVEQCALLQSRHVMLGPAQGS